MITFERDRCKGCGLCVTACPKKIVAMDEGNLNVKGFAPAFVTDVDKCISCCFCATICPDTVITIKA